MKIIGIDSSGLVASVALAADGVLLGEFTTNNKKTHSQTLLPMLDRMRQDLDLDLKTVDAIAIASGPGSFTGLRIGSATAKGLGLALDRPIVEVPTLEGLAWNLWGADGLICPMMDARREQVYTGIYEFCPDGGEGFTLHVVAQQEAIAVTDLIAKLNGMGRKVTFLGDGVPVCLDRIREELKVPYALAPEHLSRQRAGSIASLGCRYFAMGRAISSDAHAPEYLRKSQAERERPHSYEV